MTIAVNQLLDLTDRCILVTGAGGNIGGAIAARLAEAGARVVAHYRSRSERVELLQGEHGHNVLALQADLTSERDRSDLLAQLKDTGFVPNALVNNAADQSIGTLADMALDDWRKVLDANLDSVFALTQALLPDLDGGAIVNVSSIEGSDPAAGHGHYAVSKAGLNMFTRALALETAGRGIRVNSISPGLIHRDGIEQQWPEGVAQWTERAPLQRLGKPVDIADAVLYLVSPASSWVTGTNLVVDGGMSAQSRW